MMWNHDYCTVCDKQCSPGHVYCSEECKGREIAQSRRSSLLSLADDTPSPAPSSGDSSPFLYTSPMLSPNEAANSPPPSPLLMPSHAYMTFPSTGSSAASPALSTSTTTSIYRQWLSSY